jgi:hypothetical protein
MIDEAIKRAIDCDAMLYNKKTNCPDDQRDAELRWIYHLAEIAPDGPTIECGVKNGGALICWAMAREGRGQVYANDIKMRPDLVDNLKRYGTKAKRVMSPSAIVPAKIGGLFAFAFIDGDHSEDGIRADVETWPDAIMPGGILAFHDYGVWKPTVGVKKIVDEWQQTAQWELLGQVGSLIAFKRPG